MYTCTYRKTYPKPAFLLHVLSICMSCNMVICMSCNMVIINKEILFLTFSLMILQNYKWVSVGTSKDHFEDSNLISTSLWCIYLEYEG